MPSCDLQVHFVAPEVDGGAIISQAPVPVEIDDTVETLAERVKKVNSVLYSQSVQYLVDKKFYINNTLSSLVQAEHRIFPEAMEMLARGKILLRPDGKLAYKN